MKVASQPPNKTQLIEVVGTKGCGKHSLLLHLYTGLHQGYNYEPWHINSPTLNALEECYAKRREAVLQHWKQQHGEIVSALRNNRIDAVLCKNYLGKSVHYGKLIGLPDHEIRRDHATFPTPNIVVFFDYPGCEKDPEHAHLMALCRRRRWIHGRVTNRNDTVALVDRIIEKVIKRRRAA